MSEPTEAPARKRGPRLLLVIVLVTMVLAAGGGAWLLREGDGKSKCFEVFPRSTADSLYAGDCSPTQISRLQSR